jgi:hypothetical protein
MPNYAFTTRRKLPEVKEGEVYVDINFCQAVPHTPIFEGVAGLIFERCNLTNCDVPKDATVKDCLHYHIEFCSNVHPEWVEKGLPACEKECKHRLPQTVIDEKIVLATADLTARKAMEAAKEKPIAEMISAYADGGVA